MVKVDAILQEKEGYYYDTGHSVVIIYEKPSTLFRKLAGCAGYIITATEIDKRTGKESAYDLYSKDGIRTFDLDKISKFKSFGPGESGIPLIEDLKGPRKVS